MVKASNSEMASRYPPTRRTLCPRLLGLATGTARAGATATLGVKILFIVVLLPAPPYSPRISCSQKTGGDCASAGAASPPPPWRSRGTNRLVRLLQSAPG